MGQIIRASSRTAVVAEAVAAKYLTFNLGDDVYAIEVLRIKKIIEFGSITHLPMVPPFIRGILNLLGEVVPVIDLQVCFGEAASEVSRRSCIVIVEISRNGKTTDMGVVVDAVNNVIELLPTDISAAPDFGDSIRTNFIHGVGKIGDSFILLLDMSYILSMEEMSLLQQIRKQAQPQKTPPKVSAVKS